MRQQEELFYFPEGNYHVSQIVLKTGVSLVGTFEGSEIYPTTNQQGSYESALVVLDTGQVDYIEIKNLTFTGISDSGNQPVMHCFDLDGDTTTGGIWHSSFDNVRIRMFKSHGIRIVGGDSFATNNTNQAVNQFLTFKNVRVIKTQDAASKGLYMYGQNAQMTFTNCTFNGEWEEGNDDPVGANVWLESSPNGGPQTSLINFDTCIIERAEWGIIITGGYNINIRECWFENNEKAIKVIDNSQGVNITGSKFSNTGDTYVLHVEESGASFTHNVIRQANDTNMILKLTGHNYYGVNNFFDKNGTTLGDYYFN